MCCSGPAPRSTTGIYRSGLKRRRICREERAMNADGKLRLAAYFNPTGHHVASWRHPRAVVDAHINIRHYVEIAQTAERAKFDLVFLADSVGVREAAMEALTRSVQFVAHFEPLTLL